MEWRSSYFGLLFGAYPASTESGLILFPAAIIMIVFNFIGLVLADKME